MPVSFFRLANEFGKYNCEESKAIPIDLLTKQHLLVLPIEDPGPHSAYAHIQSLYLIGLGRDLPLSVIQKSDHCFP